jgi:hypothetical protein
MRNSSVTSLGVELESLDGCRGQIHEVEIEVEGGVTDVECTAPGMRR